MVPLYIFSTIQEITIMSTIPTRSPPCLTDRRTTRPPPIILYQIDRQSASALLLFNASLLYATKSARWLNSALIHVLLLWLFLGDSLAYSQNAVKQYRQIWLWLVLWVVFLPATQVATDCNAVTEILVNECQSLMELYNSTNGPNWKNHTGWNQTNTPCSWFGVTYDSLAIISLYLTYS
jgi:hypothetical protein